MERPDGDDDRLPAPLRPAAERAPGPPPRTRNEGPSRRAAAAETEAAARVPTVHVQIDRIEVWLEEPPAAPKPAARKPAGASPLDLYLARRRGGR